MKLFIVGRREPYRSASDCRDLAQHMAAVFGLEVELFLLGGNRPCANRGVATSFSSAGGDVASLRSRAVALAAQGYRTAICDGVSPTEVGRALEQVGFRVIFADGGIGSIGQGQNPVCDLSRYAFDLLRRLDPELKTVSVIVPNFNYAAYLDGRLNSIFAQTYPIFEVIVLDDASTDDSLATLARIRNESGRYFRLVANDRNSGSVFKQWSKGLGLALGELVWIAEADDLAEPQFVERLAAEFADPALNMVFANSRQVDEITAPLAESYDFYYRLHLPDLLSDVKLPGREFLQRFLGIRNAVFNVSSVIFQRTSLNRAVEASLGDLELFRVAGDWDIYIELCRQDGFIAYLSKPLNVHRRHTGSVTLSLSYWRHIAEILVTHRKIREILGDAAPVPGQAAYIAELAQQLSLKPPRGSSIETAALQRWLDELALNPDILPHALRKMPANFLDELTGSN